MLLLGITRAWLASHKLRGVTNDYASGMRKMRMPLRCTNEPGGFAFFTESTLMAMQA